METIYNISIWLILLLGVGHGAFTFKKFDKMSQEALWFFSTSLGLICCGLINYINLKFPNQTISNIALGANTFQLLFCIVLAYNIRKSIIFTALFFAFVIFVSSIGFYFIKY